jgi:hypothetical protein
MTSANKKPAYGGPVAGYDFSAAARPLQNAPLRLIFASGSNFNPQILKVFLWLKLSPSLD